MTSIASTELGTAPAPRDARIIAVVGSAHYTSHLMQLALPPLFPIIHNEFGVSYTELGLMMTLYYIVSGFGQATSGVLVDRYGAHRLLIGGLILLSLGTGLAAFATHFWMLLPLAAIAGLGNSVFHPADLSILGQRVSERLVGRAYAVHGIAGQLGYATSPVVSAAIAAFASWRVALALFGLFGIGIAILVYINSPALRSDRHVAPIQQAGAKKSVSYFGIITSPLIMMAFCYFVLTAFGGTGTQTFSITTLASGYGLGLGEATLGLTSYLLAVSAGMVIGGILADRTDQHHVVAMAGMAVCALFILILAFLSDSAPLALILAVLIVAGFANGLTAPSRDVLIRQASRGTGMGSVFGFVYSGFDLGSLTAPLLFGMLLDHGHPHGVFLATGIAFVLAAPTVMKVRRKDATIPAPARMAAE